ncbi:sensor histidine kinase [Streptomyces albus]|uniref:histidine kinase n=1 Tax=Streptomyces albus TaxID=1888 RepID=A0A6C1BZY8_9ACTN|nr:histidine kinase [Streptomyces albus]QID34416.1 two-component sensor histidine kinase [Streptomyces albus]TGG83897.1 two-component sensor histidine kinase [Streptomyces albus]UVN58802.1 histidine kinase [Streptomyces albus]
MIVRRRIPESWHRLDVTVRDLPLGVLLLVASALPAFQGSGTEIGGLPNRPADALTGVAAVLQCLPLAVRRRWPLVCLGLVSLGFALDQLRGYHLVAGTALPIALLSTGSHLERYRRLTVIAASAAWVALAVALHRSGPGKPAAEFVTFYLALVLAWGIGAWMRSARAAEAERRSRVAEDARNAERARIARELHDVVTHHVTAMVVQSEAARYLTAAPDRLDQALTAVSDTGRRAITDLRHLLDLLNPDHGTGHGGEDRTPPVGRLLTLVEQTRRAGQPVEFTEEGTPPAATGSADLVAYRVVQEALTNALKHDHGSRTSVLVRHGEREITVEVGTDGSGTRDAAPGGSGRGLEGLRERVGVLGGDFSAGRRPDGGFLVRARIPAGSSV